MRNRTFLFSIRRGCRSVSSGHGFAATAAIIKNSGLQPYLRFESTAAIIENGSLQPYLCSDSTAAIIENGGLQPYLCLE